MKYVFQKCVIMALLLNAKIDLCSSSSEKVVENDAEDLSTYTLAGDIYYKTIWKPRDCLGPLFEEDDVTMVLEYHGETPGVNNTRNNSITLRLGRGQTLKLDGDGMLGMCLGEKRSLIIPQKKIKKEFKLLIPDISELSTYLEAELVGLNEMRWVKHESGLLVAYLEEGDDENCERIVVEGDTLAVEYEGSLEDGTVFDSSAARGVPFGPFRQGHGQIIRGYEIALEGMCLGDHFKMIVPPHLAYGDQGVGSDIPPKATLHFDVRLVELNSKRWVADQRRENVYSWATEVAADPCELIAGRGDNLYIHYLAIREDKSQFGSVIDSGEPYGPFTLYSEGLGNVPGLNQVVDGMCLGETRTVNLPPRLGWAGQFETMKVSVTLVRVNDSSEENPSLPVGPPKNTEL